MDTRVGQMATEHHMQAPPVLLAFLLLVSELLGLRLPIFLVLQDREKPTAQTATPTPSSRGTKEDCTSLKPHTQHLIV